LFALVLAWAGHRRTAWISVIGAFFWLWFWSMPITVEWFKAVVIGPNKPKLMQTLPKAEAIVVLGGGAVSTGLDEGVLQPFDLKGTADRIWYGARLYREGLAPVILVSGGNALQESPDSAEANAMALFLEDLGVPPDVILMETTSRNTSENALNSAEILQPMGFNRILLVTSATHMVRATRYFENAGFEVYPAPTDYRRQSPVNKQCCLPDPNTLVTNSRFLKEYFGKLF
jgi:uncharacterized SAM-binding protein YcdF (DUF218 family)